jgi:hypothetical protein
MKKKSVGLLELETAVLECFLEKTPLSPLGVKFSETNTTQIQQLTNTLQNNTILSQNQWQQVCDEMDQMVQNI